MTSRFIRDNGRLAQIVISCDHVDCPVNLTDREIESGGGLKKMGWQAMPVEGGLRHYCPEHQRALTSKE